MDFTECPDLAWRGCWFSDVLLNVDDGTISASNRAYEYDSIVLRA